MPAVDIRDGRAVRLRQGQFDDEQVYADDPLEAARAFVEAGARFLHVVDLDGAREGRPANLHQLARIVSGTRLPVQYGGGLRSLDSIKAALDAGAGWVVIGTAAYADPEFLGEAVQRYAPRLVVAVDVRGGKVSVSGWTEQTDVTAEELIDRLQDAGVTKFLYTNADRDGTLGGVNLDEVRWVSEIVRGRFILSGGVGSLDDLRGLRELELPNLTGVIVGKALYERRFTVAEAQAELAAPPGSP
ncbi:MAG: 1-(5-phosphoribosyl)-5-[(5-phosphoribosylamino)methylideneamino]imidazole-4-carboxamide isomerase [Actinomycetota bacterium]|nr:1-(5-phosphoribosyl)-5-[(5-phosphoribosylamino)methylideneamino]imidazole-4-carboxamide isomerase [Actinomycetota bacterium]